MRRRNTALHIAATTADTPITLTILDRFRSSGRIMAGIDTTMGLDFTGLGSIGRYSIRIGTIGTGTISRFAAANGRAALFGADW
jgi:hypothetical protein